jgi:hypothetical protein
MHQGRDSQFFTKFLIDIRAYFVLAPLSGILPLACPLTLQDIPINSGAIHPYMDLGGVMGVVNPLKS